MYLRMAFVAASIIGALATFAAWGVSPESAWIGLILGWSCNGIAGIIYHRLMMRGQPELDANGRVEEATGTLLISCVPWAITMMLIVTLVGGIYLSLVRESGE